MPATSTISRPVASDPRFRFVRGDIADPSEMREVVRSFRPDVIMHLAAESHVDRSIDGPARVHPDQRRRHVLAAAGSARATGAR